MRSGYQTFSRNQYAPIYGEREATASNPSTQPAVERSKSDREGHKCRRIEGSLPPNGPASAKPTGGRLRMYTNRRITSAAYLGLRRIAPLTSLERRLPNRRNRQFGVKIAGSILNLSYPKINESQIVRRRLSL